MDSNAEEKNDLKSLVPVAESDRRRAMVALLRILNSSGKSAR